MIDISRKNRNVCDSLLSAGADYTIRTTVDQYAPFIESMGAEMIAVSADSPADGQKVASELKLSYPILSDVYKNFIKQYGVLHPTEGIARPSLFIVDKEGKIVWKYVGVEAADRPPMAVVLQQLQAVK